MESNFTRAGQPSESELSSRVDQKKYADWRAKYADKVKSAEKAMQLVHLRRTRCFASGGFTKPSSEGEANDKQRL